MSAFTSVLQPLLDWQVSIEVLGSWNLDRQKIANYS